MSDPDLSALAAVDDLYRRVSPAAEGALILAALDSGLLSMCRTPRTPSNVAAGIGLPASTVGDACVALAALGVLERHGERFTLSAAYAAALDSAAGDLLSRTLRFARARADLVSGLLSDAPAGWAADPDVRRAFAEGVSFPPDAALSLRIVGASLDRVPEAAAALASGQPHLELGCGLGGALLTKLRLFPSLTAVGVDLDPDLLAEARARAAALGVGDRVEFVACDAGRFTSSQRFGSVQWSQFFFAGTDRAGALRTALAVMTPGAPIAAPVLGEPDTLRDDPHSEEGRETAIDALVHGSWGVPLLGAADLCAELASAGFVRPRAWGEHPTRGVVAFAP